MYYRDADAALLLYDTAKPSTCDALRAWLEGEEHVHLSTTSLMFTSGSARAEKEFAGLANLHRWHQS